MFVLSESWASAARSATWLDPRADTTRGIERAPTRCVDPALAEPICRAGTNASRETSGNVEEGTIDTTAPASA